jgi:hypothetical protein
MEEDVWIIQPEEFFLVEEEEPDMLIISLQMAIPADMVAEAVV